MNHAELTLWFTKEEYTKKYPCRFPSCSKNHKPEILNARVKATAFVRVVLAGITFLVPAHNVNPAQLMRMQVTCDTSDQFRD
ncbi:MAG TPA: hypothetical protein VJ350_03410 [Methanoregula sp.]|nr:hypothetical protein [Methanoregula sp.]